MPWKKLSGCQSELCIGAETTNLQNLNKWKINFKKEQKLRSPKRKYNCTKGKAETAI